jgi:hypothetical protein
MSLVADSLKVGTVQKSIEKIGARCFGISVCDKKIRVAIFSFFFEWCNIRLMATTETKETMQVLFLEYVVALVCWSENDVSASKRHLDQGEDTPLIKVVARC